MGVINLTPDSFSDGGIIKSIDDVLAKADQYIHDGADVLDLGGQSTRPGAVQISNTEEETRVLPAIKAIRNTFPSTIISLDTFNSSTAKKALDLGVHWINDISGGRNDPQILPIIADAGCYYIIMHSRGNSMNMDQLTNYLDVVNDVYSELQQSTEIAIKSGIDKGKIIWDIGIGFAKTTEQNIKLLKNLKIFKKSQFPLLIGPSRKRFIGDSINETDPLRRIEGTIAVVCKCVNENIDLVRVHDVNEVYKSILMYSKLK